MGRVVRVSRWKLARLALRWAVGLLLLATLFVSMAPVLAHERDLPLGGIPAAGIGLLYPGLFAWLALRHVRNEGRRRFEFDDAGILVAGAPTRRHDRWSARITWLPWDGIRGAYIRRDSPLGDRSLIVFTDLGTLEIPDRFEVPLSQIRDRFLTHARNPWPSAREMAHAARRKWPEHRRGLWTSWNDLLWLGAMELALLPLLAVTYPHARGILLHPPDVIGPSWPLGVLVGLWLFITTFASGIAGVALMFLLRSRRRWAMITPEMAVTDWDDPPTVIPVAEVVRVYGRWGPSPLGGAVALRGGAIVRCHPPGLLVSIARRAPIPEAELWRRAGTITEWNARLGSNWLWGTDLRRAARDVSRAGTIGGLYRDIAVRWMLRMAYFRAMDQAARRIRRITSKPDPPKRRRIAFEDEEIDPKPLPAGPVAIKIAHRYWRWPPPQGESAVLTFLFQEIEREGLPAYEICFEAAGVRALPLRRLHPDLLQDGIDLAAALCAASGLDPDRLDNPQGARLDVTLDSVRYRFLVESGPTANGVRFTLRRPD